MTTMADEHPRGIFLSSAHCVYIPSFSNFSYFFPQVSRQEKKTFFFPFFFPPNKLPHTEVNNINTYVSGVRAGALLKLIFQNVFLLFVLLQGSRPLRCCSSLPQPEPERRGGRGPRGRGGCTRGGRGCWGQPPGRVVLGLSIRGRSSQVLPPLQGSCGLTAQWLHDRPGSSAGILQESPTRS